MPYLSRVRPLPNAPRRPLPTTASRRLAALALTAFAASALAAGPAVAAKGGGKPAGGGSTTSGTPNLVVTTAWSSTLEPDTCEPILGGCSLRDGRLTMTWLRSSQPVWVSYNLPTRYTVRNAGTSGSAATTGTFSFSRTGEVRSGAEDLQLTQVSVTSGRKSSSGTLTGARHESASFTIPSLAAGASATVDLNYVTYGAAGSTISNSSSTTRLSITPATGETSTSDNVLTLAGASFKAQG
jgi:hypothetical protein